MAYSQKLKECIETFFKENDWNYTFNDEHEYFETGIRIHNKLKRCDIYIDVYDEYYVTHGVLPISADTACMKEVSEYLHRVNYGMKWGSFEMDYNDGEIRVKCFVNCGDDCDCLPTPSVVRDSIQMLSVILEKYGDELLAVMFGFMTPEQAVEKAESKTEDENEA